MERYKLWQFGLLLLLMAAIGIIIMAWRQHDSPPADAAARPAPAVQVVYVPSTKPTGWSWGDESVDPNGWSWNDTEFVQPTGWSWND